MHTSSEEIQVNWKNFSSLLTLSMGVNINVNSNKMETTMSFSICSPISQDKIGAFQILHDYLIDSPHILP